MLASDEFSFGHGAADKPAGRFQTIDSDAWSATIALCGELDMASAPGLHALLDAHLEACRTVIRVDLGGVTFLDSTVLGELIIASDRCRRMQGALILTKVAPKVRRVFQIAGVEALLRID
ncbi:MAG TPA: STAS domain-containing protein [Mycobacterium sp.]|nr:STAS domain-containing protein [Mycobacterium sp.]